MEKSLRRKTLRHKIDILNLEWETDSRDTNITDPILVSLRDRFNYTIRTDSIWYGTLKLLIYKPKVLLIANESGAIENCILCRFAKFLGIKTMVLISEGLNLMSPDENEEKKADLQMLWGHNMNHKKIWDLKLLWSSYSLGRFYKYIPESRQYNLKVSGGVGFDSYKLLQNDNKNFFNGFKEKKYKKTILLVGFPFDLFPIYDLTIFSMDKETVNWIYSQRLKVRDVYKQLIEDNQDILFILKLHPGSINNENTEFSGIMNKYENTITIQKEYGIRKLLESSDILIAYDSTVCVEGWCLGKTTLLINPEEREFPRTETYKGSPILRNVDELNQCISSFYKNGYVKSFEKLESVRNNIIQQQIQFDDGFNYLRAAKLINDEINKKSDLYIDKGVRILFLKRIIMDILEFLIEKQPIPIIKSKKRRYLKDRSSRYVNQKRIITLENYKKGIEIHEKNNESKVLDIINNYLG